MKEDNRGIALISVMICVMLSFLLSATIMRISLLSYLQKGIAKQATTTFYENETFVDDIKLGVQQKVAMAFANSSSNSQASFLANFKTALLAAGTGGTEKAKLESALASFIQNSEALKVVSVTVEGEGGVLFKPEGEGEYVIKNVKIEYVDNTKDGYVSNIKTDIRIKSPFYITTSEPSGGGYSVVASNGAIITSGGGRGNLKQGGNLYFGYKIGTATAVEIDHKWVVDHASCASVKNGMAYWATGDNVIFNGDLTLDTSMLLFTGKKLTVRGTIYLKNKSHLVLGSTSKLVCKDIVVDGKSAANGTYSFSNNAGSVSGPPVDFNGENSSRTTWFGKASSIDEYSGNGQKNNGTTQKKGSAANITFDANMRPVTNVKANGAPLDTKASIEGTGDQYDYQFREIIDVAYLNAITDFNNKTPKGYINTYTAANSDGSGKWSHFSGYTTPNNMGFQGNVEFPIIEGKKVGVNFGNNVQTVNSAFGYIMINWSKGEQTLGTLNINNENEMAFYGMMFTRGSMKMIIQNPKLGIGTTFVEFCDGDVAKAKRILKILGRGVTTDSGINQSTDAASMAVREKNNINNMFRNGILSILDEDSGTHEDIVSHDETKNKSLEVVTFENWEKY